MGDIHAAAYIIPVPAYITTAAMVVMYVAGGMMHAAKVVMHAEPVMMHAAGEVTSAETGVVGARGGMTHVARLEASGEMAAPQLPGDARGLPSRVLRLAEEVICWPAGVAHEPGRLAPTVVS